jgi:hypothetical protein
MLTTLPQNDLLDLPPWAGQRKSTFSFTVINGLTGEQLGTITPLRTATLRHNTTSTIKRTLSISLGKIDTGTIDPVTARVDVEMVLQDGSVWPLGRYMFTTQTKIKFTSGMLSNAVLNDEMFIVDQPMIKGFDATNKSVTQCYEQLLADLPVEFIGEPSVFRMTQGWGASTSLGSVLNSLAVAGDYFAPWFSNDKKMHLIRTFNPVDQVPQFDWDSRNQVLREAITDTSNVLTAPNRFQVVSNTNVDSAPIVGLATVPPTAPHSFANRGFYITQSQTLQLFSQSQAQAVATGLANRLTVFETVTLNTLADPRHDSYDVIFWNGSFWLELAWDMNLTAGGGGIMNHTLRKAYMP